MGSATEPIQTVDDLAYDLPANILDYDKRFWFGLTATDIIPIAAFGSLLGFVHPMLAVVGGLVGLLLVIRFDGLGNQSLVQFGLAYLRHRMTKRPVVLPLILPSSGGMEEYTITDADGNQYRIGGDG